MQSKIRILGFQKLKQKQDFIPHHLFSKSENAVNLIIYSIKKTSSSWVSQIQSYAKKQLTKEVKLFKCIQAEAFEHIISKFINTKHQKTICLIDFPENQTISQFQSQMQKNKNFIDALKLLDFILIVQRIEGIDKKLFSNPNIKLITTQVQRVKAYIQKELQSYRQLRPQSSVSTINQGDQVKFQQDFNKVFKQVKIVQQQKQSGLSTNQEVYNSTPGVGSYEIGTKFKNSGSRFGKQYKFIDPKQWSPSKTKNQQSEWWGSPKKQKL